MSTYRLPPREIPLDDSWDVIVAGGGPAGCTAAAAAAREGAKTLLIEATGALGGMGTAGLVPAWCPFSDKQKIIYRGLAEKVFTACKEPMSHVHNAALDWVAIDPELLKRLYDDLVTEAGASVLFGTCLAAADADDAGRVSAIIVANKAGLSAYSAGVYVDCTGDADLAAWAGAPFEKGDQAGRMQPATHCFVLSNVDDFAHAHGSRMTPDHVRAINDDDRFPLVRGSHACNHLIGPATVGFNSGHLWDVDNTNPASLSRAMMNGRKFAAQFRDALAAHLPKAFGNAFLVTTGSLMGIRETRRIVGDYVLTLDDYRRRRSFPDEICRNSYWIDVHISEAEAKLHAEGKLDMAERGQPYGPGESHGIPYRCLTPKGLTNVLVAGRSISTDRMTQGSTRVMPVCLAMGEAAGVAAAFAAGNDPPDVHAIDTDRLRRRLREHGAYLP